MRRLHYLQHVPFETPGAILTWAREKGYQISHTRLFLDEPFPSAGDFDLLVIMGGPMSVHDEAQYPWLVEEKAFLRDVLRANDQAKVLGICLGAQLLAEVLGGEVYPNRYKEIGWFPIELTKTGLSHPLFQGWPKSVTVFHWHGETFRLPPEALHLAYSEACENQAFLFEERVLGLQFHLEVTPEIVAELLENSAQDLVPGPFVQDPEIIKGQPDLFEHAHQYLFKLLETFEDL